LLNVKPVGESRNREALNNKWFIMRSAAQT
jgi:hypothetical protein